MSQLEESLLTQPHDELSSKLCEKRAAAAVDGASRANGGSGGPASMGEMTGHDSSHDHSDETKKCSSCNDSIQSTTPSSMFQTAGKNVTIHVSKDSVAKANALFSKNEIDSSSRPQETVKNVEEKGSSLKAVQYNRNQPHVPCPIFQTAGKNVVIHVSEDSIAKANDLFSHATDESSSKPLAPMVECQTKRSANDLFTTFSSTNSPNANDKKVPAEANQKNALGAVFNPYTSRKAIAHTPKKLTLEDRGETSSFIGTMKTTKVSAATQVNNPYANSKSVFSGTHTARQTFVKNPYAMKQLSPIKTTESASIIKVIGETTDLVQQSKEIKSSDPQSSIIRSVPISRFFSMADRLPSRNVSYQPSEILSVGELYRYLYHPRRDCNSPKQDISAIGDVTEPVYRELTSVRITGVLLSSAYSDPEEECTKLLGKGQWLLIGDPLDRSRFENKQTHEQLQGGPGTVRSLGKSKEPSSKEDVITDADTTKLIDLKQKSTPSAHHPSLATPLQSKSLTIPKDDKMASTCRSGGLLNDKKRKFVYSKPAGRNSLSSTKSVLNAKKFQTPKRFNSTSSTSMNSVSNKMADLSSSKKGISQTGKAASLSQTPSAIIQNHPSPIVLVWNGSRWDGNELDGSVIGDLVMIMGEIVIELCDRCKDHKGDEIMTEVNEQVPHVDNCSIRSSSVSACVHNIQDAARLISSLASRYHAIDDKRCCDLCVKFLRARFVKNANGTDMNLQKQALCVRRDYMKKRKEEMASIVSDNSNLLVTGSGPFV